MSAPTNDNNPIITLGNYEEYFLMYVDDELTQQEKAMVEAFLQFHPELQAEIDLLMETKLMPEVLNFEDKESLFAKNMMGQNIDENLLLYVDDELDEVRKKMVAEKLNNDAAYQKQYQWLLRTKSNPAEVVLCPNKEELYRHTVHRMRFGFALRIAAAVLFIASMGVLYLQQDNNQDAVPVAVIPKQSTNPAQTSKPADVPSNSVLANTAEKEKTLQTAKIPDANSTPVAAVKQPSVKKIKKAATSPKTPMPDETTPAAENRAALAYESVPLPRKSSVDMQTLTSGKKELGAVVTSGTRAPYNIPDAPVAEPDFAVSKEDGHGKGNIKSLLRKATRLVERRAGINATNEDEELLIGVVALKLK